VIGVTVTEIKVGRSATPTGTPPLTEHASAYGTIGTVVEAYFKKVNNDRS
jgi:hypothetical protein